jgi:hypothetical protein
MHKLLAATIILLCTLSNVFAESGYKQYEWGMTVKQVLKICPDLSQIDFDRWAAPSYALMFFRKNELQTEIPNPLAQEKGTISFYESKKNNEIEFYFVAGKLPGVKVDFLDSRIINDLTKKYGSVSLARGSYRSYSYQTAS